MPPEKVLVGWREYVALPVWGVDGVLTKVDTGARTSSLHVRSIEELPGDQVRFDVALSRKNTDLTTTVVADLVRISKVRPSSGHHQHRHVVRTVMRLGPVEKEIEISLVCRQAMLCRMLLGRTALDPEFLVDPAHRYVFGRPKRKRRKRP